MQEDPDSLAGFAKSTVVSTSAPREMGSLRDADGQEAPQASAHASKLAQEVPAYSNGVEAH